MTDWQLAFDHLEAKINEDLLESYLKNINSCSGGDENELKAWVSKLDHLLYYSKVDETTFVSHIAFLAKGFLNPILPGGDARHPPYHIFCRHSVVITIIN